MYEYKWADLGADMSQAPLDILADDGWRVVSVSRKDYATFVPQIAGTQHFFALCERMKVIGPEIVGTNAMPYRKEDEPYDPWELCHVTVAELAFNSSSFDVRIECDGGRQDLQDLGDWLNTKIKETT